MSPETKGIFITGTDTGVGKTVISAALLTILRNKGIDAVPMKPIQTGCIKTGAELIAPDLEFCLKMSGLSVSEKEKKLMLPYCFEKACSPHLASEQAGQKISINRITDSLHALKEKHQFIVVEGAGGILVPIDAEKTMLDLMTAMALPVVLVARPSLGTINHTLLSIHELRRANISVSGVIINESRAASWGDIESDNIKTIERMGELQVIGHLPFLSDIDTMSQNHFAKLSGKYFTTTLMGCLQL